jgi:hypothetical protein
MFSIVLRVPLGANPSNSSRSWVPLPMVRVTTLSPSVICSSMLKWRSQLPPLGGTNQRLSTYTQIAI